MNEYLVSCAGTMNLDALFQWMGKRFPIRLLPEEDAMEADFLFCDTFHPTHERFQGVKILITGENHPADLNHFDYCLTHGYQENDRCHRFPYWQYVTILHPSRVARLSAIRPLLCPEELEGRDFCAFVSYNAAAKKRIRLVKTLMRYRRCSCGGPLMNNIGGCVQDKIDFMSRHLFGVAYENEASPGYVTEKIIDAFRARCIPLYWGDPYIEREFNPDAFIHARRFRNRHALVRHILELSEDRARMAAILNAPVFQSPDIPERASRQLENFLGRIFERGPGCIRRTRCQRLNAFLSHFYGHGLFRSLRYISRSLRHKQQ